MNRFQETDAFIQASKRTPVDLARWATDLLVAQNRFSHVNGAAAIQPIEPVDASSVRTPTADFDLNMQALSIDPQGTSRPYPARSSSHTNNGAPVISEAPVSLRGQPPVGPLPQIPQIPRHQAY
jgi:hypothetical protein